MTTIPDMPDDAPWWAWMIVAILVIVVPAVVTWLVQRSARAKIEAIDGQLTNSHAEAEYPNLREELTAFRIEATSQLAEMRKDVGGLRSDTRGLAEADRLDRAAAVDAHKQIYDALALDRERYAAQHAELLAAVHANHQPPL